MNILEYERNLYLLANRDLQPCFSVEASNVRLENLHNCDTWDRRTQIDALFVNGYIQMDLYPFVDWRCDTLSQVLIEIRQVL